MATQLIGFKWQNREARGYTDIFPAIEFERNQRPRVFFHDVQGPQGEHSRAKCRLSVSDNRAFLDYNAFRNFNRDQGWYLGQLRLEFSDATRTELQRVAWKDPSERHFSEAPVEIIPNLLPTLKQYQKNKDSSSRTLRHVRERPGQIEFRKTLLLAYDGRCCITGCSVREALEAAHIDSFSGQPSDTAQNGLLIRRDLHALFDAGLLAVEPKTLLVHFAPAALSDDTYKGLHRAVRISPPTHGGPSYLPSRGALARRWKAFLNGNGKKSTSRDR